MNSIHSWRIIEWYFFFSRIGMKKIRKGHSKITQFETPSNAEWRINKINIPHYFFPHNSRSAVTLNPLDIDKILGIATPKEKVPFLTNEEDCKGHLKKLKEYGGQYSSCDLFSLNVFRTLHIHITGITISCRICKTHIMQ